MGLRRQGRPDGPGHDHRRRRQLPRPHHDDHQLLRPTRWRADGFGPFTPGFRDRAVRRRRPRSRRRSTRPPWRSCSSRSRARPACSSRRAGYLRGRPRALHPRRTSCWSPTRSSPGSGGPARPSPASSRASSPTSTCSARRSAAASSRCRPSSRSRDVLGVLHARQPRLHVRRQPAGRAVGHAVVGLLATGEYQERAQRCSASSSSSAWRPLIGRRASSRCAAAACGPASTSTPR